MPRSPPEMRTVRPFAAGAVLWGSAAGSGSRSGAGVFSGAALTGVSLVSCTGGAATAASSGSGRVGLRCSVFGPASARSNVSSNSSLYKSQTLLSTIFGRSASSCQSLCGGKGNSFPHPAGAASAHFFRSSPALRRARRHLCGFDKFPLNNIAQSGEKIKWSPVIFSRSSHFFHRFRGSREASSGALRPAWPAVKRKIPAKAAVPHRPAVPSR